MNHQIAEQNPFAKVDKSRKLHDLLLGYDAALRDLEANAASYKVADYNQRFQAITLLRQQTIKAIQDLTR